MILRRLWAPLLVSFVGLVVALNGSPAAFGSPSDSYAGARFGDGNLPAGCIADRDPINPDNVCYHMKVGLNALDSPKVDVDVLVPVSPAAERDMRIATQAVQMWDDGLHYLADEMDLDWLSEGFKMDVRTRLVPVGEDGLPKDPIDLVDPEIVVVVSNPAGGIGIGIDPTAFAGELGIIDDQGVPCAEVADPFSMATWEGRDGFEQHGAEPGGTYVAGCDGDGSGDDGDGGVGGNVCFAVNGAVDPVPGLSDFFPLFDLVSHEFGHCLTLGHVGDGADGPWGPTATNDIMAYSTDPPLVNKCVSTLNVEGFALQMSKYLDVNGDGKVNEADALQPNDVKGDGMNSFQVQHPDDHSYASSTGDPRDCPQPDLTLVPGAEGDFMPEPVDTTRPKLELDDLTASGGNVTVAGTARYVPLGEKPTSYSGSASDDAGDANTPLTDLTDLKVEVSRNTIDATMKAAQVWPTQGGTSIVAYSLNIDGRRFDSFIPNGSTDGKPVVMDNGTGYFMPAGTAKWDTAENTVSFSIPRNYLADQEITAPYNVYGVTGYHTRSNDWVANDDLLPNKRNLDLAAPKMGPETRDAPKAKTVTTDTYKAGSGSFLPSDSTLGVGLISAVETRDYINIPIKKQASALVTLKWNGDAFLGLKVGGGSSQKVISEKGNTITMLVPWARRDLTVTVDPQEVFTPTDYTLTVKRTTVVADRDKDGVPDVADDCKSAKGPSTGAGCPDSDGDMQFDKFDSCPQVPGLGADGCPTPAGEQVVALVDGKKVDTRWITTKHGVDRFVLQGKVAPAANHELVLKWFEGGKLVKTVKRTF